MKYQIHQKLNVNSFETEEYNFKSELHMQGVIYENPKLISFADDEEPNILTNELYLTNRKRVDLVINLDDELGIVELKNKLIDKSAFKQLIGYLSEIVRRKDKILNDIYKKKVENEDLKLFGLLVGPSISQELINEIIKHNETPETINIYVIILKQYNTSNDQKFIVSTPIVSRIYTVTKGRNYDKYRFNGENYGKGRLVLAVLKDYVERHPDISLVKLKEIFSNTLLGSYSAFNIVESIETVEQQNIISRYFFNDPIMLKDESNIVICSQWGINNIDAFIEKANNLGCGITKV